MTLNVLRWSRVKLSILKDHLHCIPTFQILCIDYLGQSFTKLKYNDASAPIIRRDQFHLDPHTDFISTWLYPEAFCHCIRNADSPVSKYCEVLASHYDDLRFERYLCPYASRAALDSRALSRWVTCSVTIYSYISPVCHTMSPHFLVKRTINSCGTQRPSLDRHHYPIMMHHLVMNIFKNYTINLLFIVH